MAELFSQFKTSQVNLAEATYHTMKKLKRIDPGSSLEEFLGKFFAHRVQMTSTSAMDCGPMNWIITSGGKPYTPGILEGKYLYGNPAKGE